jgi:plastocyanin
MSIATNSTVVVLLGTVLLGTVVTAAACGSTAPTVAETPPLIVEDPVDAAQAGHIVGKVTFDGTPPPPEPISMRSDPYCEREHPDGATVQRIKTGPDAGLQNVFVYVAAGLEGLRFPVPSTPVVLDQQRCTYEPRVFGIQVGQPLELLNSDATLHNVHAAAVANQEFNRGQANRGDRHTHVFSTREVMVPFKCDVHRWMNAWAGVLDHPFYSSTTEDGGFRLERLPPGTYTIEAWHEVLGTLTQTVTLEERATQSVSFIFRAS